MKTLLKSAFLLIVAIIFSAPIHGQQKEDLYPELEGRTPIIINLQNGNDGQEIIDIINTTTSPLFRNPKAPRYVLSDRKGQYGLGIGGYVRTTAEYDFDGIVNSVDFIPALIPIGAPKQSNQIQMDITTTLLFAKLVGYNDILGNFVVFTDGNFRGKGNTFILRHAYMSFRGFTIGHTEGMFMDLSACPPTIDFQGPNGMTYYRVTQVGYERMCNWGIKFGIAIENPTLSSNYYSSYNTNGTSYSYMQAKQRYPNVPAFIQYNWNPQSHIRFGGLFRSMSYINSKNDVKSEIGWGMQASTTFNIYKFQVYGQYTYGKGIGSYFNDLSILNVDLVPDYKNPSKMNVLPMVGWYAGLQYNISRKVFCSATYSANYLNSRNEFSKYNPTTYKKGQYVVANLFWNVTNDLQVGAEYLHGYKKNFNHEKKNANRINLCAQYSF